MKRGEKRKSRTRRAELARAGFSPILRETSLLSFLGAFRKPTDLARAEERRSRSVASPWVGVKNMGSEATCFVGVGWRV